MSGTNRRVVVYGVGAVGGVLASALTLAGHEVVGVARGKQLAAIRKNGLRLRTSQSDRVAQFECVGRLDDIKLRPDDMILVCVKSHDTAATYQALRQADVREQALFCTQNGIANEREALRYFPNVHGIMVDMPSMYLHHGEVAVFGAPNFGILDVGGVPSGVDDADTALVERLLSANFAAAASADIMASKRGKLLLNLGNIVQAALGFGTDSGDVVSRLRVEAESVYRARGLTWLDANRATPKKTRHFDVVAVPGVERVGGSTLQSLLRETGSIETDFLNGEIVLQGQLAGIETPLNAAMTRLGEKLLRDNAKPGSMTLSEMEALLGKP